MQANHALKDMTVAELECQLRINEEEYADKSISYHSYMATKNLLVLSIIDKQTGPLKRDVFRAIEPQSAKFSPAEWTTFQTTLTGLRSRTAVLRHYVTWRNMLNQANPINAAA